MNRFHNRNVIKENEIETESSQIVETKSEAIQ